MALCTIQVPVEIRDQVRQVAERMGWTLGRTVEALARLGGAASDEELLDALRQESEQAPHEQPASDAA